MRRKFTTAVAVAGLGLATFAGTASAAPREGKCVAATLSALPGSAKAGVAKSAPGALAGAIQLHLDGQLSLVGAPECSAS